MAINLKEGRMDAIYYDTPCIYQRGKNVRNKWIRKLFVFAEARTRLKREGGKIGVVLNIKTRDRRKTRFVN